VPDLPPAVAPACVAVWAQLLGLIGFEVFGQFIGEGTATQRLADAVSSFVRWHARGRTTARVVQYELDSLGPDARAEIVGLRRQVDAEVRGIIEDGVRSGEFDVPDVPGTTLAVLSLCIDVARWFNVDGPRTPEEVGALYADLVLRMVGARRAGTS
ncbi:hypothetical protein AB0H06_31185, partial [Streptomyces althioticus]